MSLRRGAGPAAMTVVAALLVGGCSATISSQADRPPTAQSTTAARSPTAPPSSAEQTVTDTTTDVSTSSTPTATPTATPTPTAGVTATQRTTLHPGDKGADVLAMQKQLAAAGYWLGTPDGVFGGLSLQAVYAVQKAAGIGRDGVVGPVTAKAIANGVRPKPSISGDGVEINLSRQLLLIVRGGTVAYTLNTSTGSGQEYISSYGTRAIATTPRGIFRVFRTVNGQDVGKLGVLWRPRYFNGGIAVHGSPSIPPYPASHGCARLSNAAIDMIWAKGLMPIGSRVVVT